MPRFLLVLLVSAALPAAAEECYSVDPAGGSVAFELVQAGSPFRGAFRWFGGELCIAQSQVARIDVWLEPASVETGLPEIDAALKAKEFFDVGGHPRIAFASESVQARGDRQLARGGKPVVSGSFTLDRRDYGIGSGEWSDTRWLGAEVKIDFSATLSRR